MEKINEIPEKTDSLENRVLKLEELFKEPIPKWCPKCKQQTLNLEDGIMLRGDGVSCLGSYRNWICSNQDCNNKIEQFFNEKAGNWISIDQS